jgi:hypothetical protein
MAVVEKHILINASSDQIWQVLSDFDSISTWSGVVDHSTYLTPENSGIGSARRIQQGANTLIETVTEWNEGELLAYTLSGLPPVFRSATNCWRISQNETPTKVSLTIELLPVRPPAALPAAIASRVIAGVNKKLLRDLKKYVEPSKGKEEGLYG